MHPLFARLLADLEDVKRECRSIEDAIRLFDSIRSIGPEPARSWARWKAVGGGIDSAYSGIEKILRSVAKEIDRYVPADDQWHLSLLKQMSVPVQGVREAVLSPETFDLLNEVRAFRHLVRNLYGFRLHGDRVEENLERLRRAVPAFEADFRRFVHAMSGTPA